MHSNHNKKSELTYADYLIRRSEIHTHTHTHFCTCTMCIMYMYICNEHWSTQCVWQWITLIIPITKHYFLDLLCVQSVLYKRRKETGVAVRVRKRRPLAERPHVRMRTTELLQVRAFSRCCVRRCRRRSLLRTWRHMFIIVIADALLWCINGWIAVVISLEFNLESHVVI